MKSNFSKMLFIAMLLTFIVLTAPVVAVKAASFTSPPAQANPLDLNAFLQWLITGGGSIMFVSWLFERMNWFQMLSSDAKDNTIFGAAVVIGCAALAIVTYVPAAILAMIAPYFLVISSVFTLVFVAKAFHKADKAG